MYNLEIIQKEVNLEPWPNNHNTDILIILIPPKSTLGVR